MALNYSDRETLRPLLLPRIRQAIDKFFMFVLGGSPTQARKDYCQNNLTNIGMLAEQCSHYVMSETAFIDGGTSISDAALQSRVEFALQNHLGMPA
jgi:hypothetical protein